MSIPRTEQQRQAARDRAKAWYCANRDRSLAANKRWYSHPENAAVARARAIQWRIENPERARAGDKKKQRNIEQRRIYQINRVARTRANGGVLSRNIARLRYAEQRGLCNVCREDMGTVFDLDHIIPISRGGPNTDENIQLLCPPCNRRKGAK